ncbi:MULTISPECIES: hypothetical protein [unclassified Lysobacter]|uniref:hypothetical protein n=1 Tax=unclassified Lysobacter TaxID=2635362 RepID=UPI000701A717|nr:MULTISPECIES: hypothetical protein [unclassified Lysobacter]KQZ56463.1 hypothetical protein ASD53_13025 [Lysobacter sp. Root559]KRC35094.1 hypothetical protein ASE10_10515 [Lysobacter sp. Root76]KRD70782.1 hypothetical protein ASE45_02680 [Lysobacter sp. Root96]
MKPQTLACTLSFAAALAAISATAQETPKMRPMMTSAEKIATIDSDHDGIVTAAEHAAGARAMFERMDANHDGKVTAAEMDAAHQAMMSGDGAKKANADDPPPNERPMDNKKKD